MNDLSQQPQKRSVLMVYKMVIFYIFLFSINSLATAIVASFLNSDWSTLNPTAKFLSCIAILQNWTGVMLAFFNRSIQRAEQGQPLIPTGDTGQWRKIDGGGAPGGVGGSAPSNQPKA